MMIAVLVLNSLILAGGLAALYLLWQSKSDVQRRHVQYLAENASLKQTVAALQSQIEELCTEIREKTIPIPQVPTNGLNMHKRAEALRMYRRGGDQATVSAALGLPHAEVALLEKVHHVISSNHAAEPEGRRRVEPVATPYSETSRRSFL